MQSNNQANLDYGMQLWGAASTSSIEILEYFQSEDVHMIVAAPSFVLNAVIRRGIQTPAVEVEIRHYSSQYSARLSVHPNDLVVNLTRQPDKYRRL
jgi:hypothetical protein